MISDKTKQPKYEIQETAQGDVTITGLTEVNIANYQDAMSYTAHCLKQRAIRATNCNMTSSRSHCIYSLTLVQKYNNEVKMTKLRFVDLAGSEKIPKIFQSHEH